MAPCRRILADWAVSSAVRDRPSRRRAPRGSPPSGADASVSAPSGSKRTVTRVRSGDEELAPASFLDERRERVEALRPERAIAVDPFARLRRAARSAHGCTRPSPVRLTSPALSTTRRRRLLVLRRDDHRKERRVRTGRTVRSSVASEGLGARRLFRRRHRASRPSRVSGRRDAVSGCERQCLSIATRTEQTVAHSL